MAVFVWLLSVSYGLDLSAGFVAKDPNRTGSLVAITSGANMNFDRLRHVAERAKIGAARELYSA